MKTFLIINIKMYKSNIFLIVSNSVGKTLLVESGGTLGFKGKKKVSIEVINKMVFKLFNFFFNYEKCLIFFKFNGVKREIANVIYKKMVLYKKNRNKVQVVGFTLVNKIGHNGCRKKK